MPIWALKCESATRSIFTSGLKKSANPFVLIFDNIQDPHNLGACHRTADAATVDPVVIFKDRAVSLTDTVRKIACGAAETVPFFPVTNLATVMRKLKEEGIWMVGTSDRAKKSLYDMDLTSPTGIVIGGETDGVRRLTADLCDFLVSITMSGEVSLSQRLGCYGCVALRGRTAEKELAMRISAIFSSVLIVFLAIFAGTYSANPVCLGSELHRLVVPPLVL